MPLSSPLARPRATRRLGRRFLDRRGGWIAERQQHRLGSARAILAQFPQSPPERLHPEIGGARTAPDAIDKRAQIDQLASGIHEIEIKHLLLSHHVLRSFTIRSKAKIPIPNRQRAPTLAIHSITRSADFRGAVPSTL